MNAQLFLLCTFTCTFDEGQLSGVVQAELGKPISGATVMIDSAGPKVGIGHLCPGCYPDCGKQATTDAQGKFIIRDLDPKLKFQVLVVATGFAPTVTEKYFDPLSGELDVSLQPSDLEKRDPLLVVRGQVMDEKGAPIARALIRPSGYRLKTLSSAGDFTGIDRLAISNERGEFKIGVFDKEIKLSATIYAKDMAVLEDAQLLPGLQVNFIRMVRGVTVTGKLTKDGEPVPGIVMNLDGWESSSRARTSIATDANGVFTFRNIPADSTYCVYGTMESCRRIGSVRVRPFEVGGNGTTRNVGTLTIQPGYRLSGRVIMIDKNRIPDGSRVNLSRYQCSEFQSCVIEEDGTFSFIGLSRGMFNAQIRIPRHVLSLDNHPRRESPTLTLTFPVESDVADLRLYVEKETPQRLSAHWGEPRDRRKAMLAEQGGEEFDTVRFSKDTTLEDGVRRFNEHIASKKLFYTHPPVTDDEVISAIRFAELKADMDPKLKEMLLSLPETRALPPGSFLKLSFGSRSRDYYNSVWEIQLGLRSPSETKGPAKTTDPTFVVRRVHTGKDHFSDTDIQIAKDRRERERAERATSQKK